MNATTGAAQTGTLSGNGAGTLTYAITVPPQDGTARLTNASTGAITYTSHTDFSGTDSFQFTVTNSAGTSKPATETVTVTADPPIPVGAYQAPASVGINVEGVTYYSTGQAFVDMIKQSGAWQAIQATGASGGTALDQLGELDTNGWPEVDAALTVACCAVSDGLSGDPGNYNLLAGVYQLSFTGKATVAGDDAKVSNYNYVAATNQSTAQVDYETSTSNPGGILILDFRNTQRTASSPVGSGITNVHLIRPQFAPNGQKWWDSPTQEFTDPFLATLKGFTTLRFLDWTAANESEQVNWSDRTPPNWGDGDHEIPYTDSYVNRSGWQNTGASYEDAIALANAVHEDMWINIPAMATDDYVTQLAKLLKANLDPSLHVYVEYSNEVWNFSFWQYNYNYALAVQQAANDPAFAADCQNKAYGQCRVGERIVQISNDFASVYGQAAINTIIRPVYATQFSWTWALSGTLEYINAAFGPPSKYIYGVAQALYWGYTPPSLVGSFPASDASGNLMSYAVSTPAHGKISVNAATGGYVYTPTAGYSGADSFIFTATDTSTHLVSNSGTINVSVAPVASTQTTAPVAFGASLAAYENTSLTGNLEMGDAFGDPYSNVMTYALTQPTHGSVSLSTIPGEFIYTPNNGYSGTDSFTFKVTDTLTQLTSNSAAVNITVGSTAPTQAAAPLVSNLSLSAWSDPLANVTEPQILAGMQTYLQQRIPVAAASFTPYALYWGLHSFSYEGGTGWDSNASVPLNSQANNDPLAGEEVTDGLNAAFENGVDMYMYFLDTGGDSIYGYYGSTTDVLDTTAPKYAALHKYISTPITRSVGVSVSATGPTTIPGWQPTMTVVAGGYCPPGIPLCAIRQGSAGVPAAEYAYMINVAKAGNYTLSLTVESDSAGTPTQAGIVLVNQTPVGTVDMSSDVRVQSTTTPIVVTLPQGLSLIEIEGATNAFDLYGINLAPD